MKTVNLEHEKLDLEGVINLARQGPLLLLTPDGQQFCVAPADDFETEVESLRRSETFQRFLDERSACTRRVPLEEVEAEIDRQLAERPIP
jgi:hypothetical protein